MFPAKLTNMKKISSVFLLMAVVPLLAPAAVAGQTFAAVGTRAAGMGGAFVAVADDATAIYWNPAGLAAGSYFSLVLDGLKLEATPGDLPQGSHDSSFLVGLAIPALGIGYYRLESRVAVPVPAPTLLPVDGQPSSRNLSVAADPRVDHLVTHHAGVTLVQSLWKGVAVGSTLKLVRGIAASTTLPAATAREALESDVEMLGRSSNHFDLDAGFMASGGPLKVGLTVRNILEPEFESADPDIALGLERQARAGLSYAISPNLVAAADFDLLRTHDAFGERRDIALGVEGRLGARVRLRSGFAVNTLDVAGEGASRRAYSVGGSYAIKSAIFVDGHFTTGNDRAGEQWGLAARFVY